jgi:hypothetical protein
MHRGLVAAGWLAALTLRAGWTLDWSRSPFWTGHRLDCLWYHEAGLAWAAGDWWLGTGVLHMSPLYSVWVGLHYLVGGAGSLLPALSGLALSLVTVWAVADAARRAAGPTAHLVGLWSAAVCAPLVFYAPILVATTLATTLAALQVRALVVALQAPGDRSPAAWARVGLWTGLGIITRPNILLLVPILGLAALLPHGGHSLRRRFQHALALGVVTGLLVAPVTLRNVLVAGETILVTDSGGLNFYLGNGAGALGTFRIPPELPQATHPEAQFRLFREAAEAGAGRALAPREVDAWWFARARADMAADPPAWLRLMGRKVALYWHGDDLPNTHSLPFARRWSPWLAWLPGFGLWSGLALAATLGGLFGRDPVRATLAWVSLTFCAMLVLFFVLGHYRTPALPVMLVLVAASLTRAGEAARAGVRLPILSLGLAAVSSVLFSLRPLLPDTLADEAYKMGFQWHEAGALDRARPWYEAALALDPALMPAHNNLGHLCAVQADWACARHHWQALRQLGEAAGSPARVQQAEEQLQRLPTP